MRAAGVLVFREISKRRFHQNFTPQKGRKESHPIIATVCTVLPRPISSAKIPLMPLLYNLTCTQEVSIEKGCRKVKIQTSQLSPSS